MKMIYENAAGVQFDFTNNEWAWLIDVQGQTQASANIATSTIAGVDGDEVNGAQALPRTLVFTFRIKSGVTTELAKRAFLKIIKLKQIGKVIWEQELRTLRISGTVQAIDLPRWNNQNALQVTLHCSNPYWIDENNEVVEIRDIEALHYFTDLPNDQLFFDADGQAFSVYDFARTREVENIGDAEAGMQIEILALGTVTNPVILNDQGQRLAFGTGTGDKMVVLSEGDVLRVNTATGHLSVVLNGTTSLFNKVVRGSNWIKLAAGLNTIAINSDDESTDNMSFTVQYTPLYV